MTDSRWFHVSCSTKPRSLQFTASWRLRGRSGWTDADSECFRGPRPNKTSVARTALNGVPSAAPWPRLRVLAALFHLVQPCSLQANGDRRPVPSTSTRAVPAASVTLQAESLPQTLCFVPRLSYAPGHTQKNGEELGGLRLSCHRFTWRMPRSLGAATAHMSKNA